MTPPSCTKYPLPEGCILWLFAGAGPSMAWQRSELPSPVPSESPTRDPSVSYMEAAAVDDGSPQRSPLSKSFLRPADEAAVLPNVRGAAQQDASRGPLARGMPASNCAANALCPAGWQQLSLHLRSRPECPVLDLELIVQTDLHPDQPQQRLQLGAHNNMQVWHSDQRHLRQVGCSRDCGSASQVRIKWPPSRGLSLLHADEPVQPALNPAEDNDQDAHIPALQAMKLHVEAGEAAQPSVASSCSVAGPLLKRIVSPCSLWSFMWTLAARGLTQW